MSAPTDSPGSQHLAAGYEAQFRLLVDSVKDYAIFMLDPDGFVSTWNAGAQNIKGYSANEIVGKHVSVFYTATERQAGLADQLLSTARREGRVAAEGWRVRKDGSLFWADVVITAMYSEGGTLQGFAKVTRDLTVRRRAEEERVRLVQAQEAIRLRDDFLSIASHELKTPLAALLLHLHALLTRLKVVDGGLALKLERAIRAGDRLAELIDALLDASIVANGTLAIRLEPLDLSEVAHEVCERVRDAASRAGCELTLTAPAPVQGAYDRLRIEQMLTNLLSNAIKYASGYPIEVSCRQDGKAAVLEVRDHGPGLPEGALPRIFERFERASPVSHGGMGLGLYIAHEIAEALGGSLTAANPESGGALFTARLPLQPVPRPRVRPSAPVDDRI